MEATTEVKQLKDVLKFRLEFMLMMHSVGRTDEANEMLGKLFSLIEQVEGEYKDPRDVRMDEIRADFAQGRC
jgi:hypothetical protein